MKHLFEEVAYLKGLAEGMDIDKDSKEGKMIHKIVDVLEVFADSIVVLSEDQDDLKDYVDSIDEDLAVVEDSLEDIFEEDDEDYDDLDFIEMECPNCGEYVEIDEDLLYDDDVDIVCPECDAVILSSEDDYDEVCSCGDCKNDEE